MDILLIIALLTGLIGGTLLLNAAAGSKSASERMLAEYEKLLEESRLVRSLPPGAKSEPIQTEPIMTIPAQADSAVHH